MSHRVPLRCRCGKIRGELDVSRRRGQRVICYCDDCQAYARALERQDVLDPRGGTDLWQTRPALVRLLEGQDEIACMRLREGGMYRWYARCCRTPIANTMSARVPFVGLHCAFLDHEARDELLGPPTRVQGRFAIGGCPEGAHPSVSAGVILRTLTFLARSFLARGGSPSPFFDPITKRPRVEPELLAAAAR